MSDDGTPVDGEKPEDLKAAAFAGPAIYITRCLAVTQEDTLRIAFVDQAALGKPIHFRTAVAMSISQAFQLRDLLIRKLGPIELAKNASKSDAQD